MCVTQDVNSEAKAEESLSGKSSCALWLWNARERGEEIFVATLKAINVSSYTLNMCLSPFQPFRGWQLSLWKPGYLLKVFSDID